MHTSVKHFSANYNIQHITTYNNSTRDDMGGIITNANIAG